MFSQVVIFVEYEELLWQMHQNWKNEVCLEKNSRNSIVCLIDKLFNATDSITRDEESKSIIRWLVVINYQDWNINHTFDGQ